MQFQQAPSPFFHVALLRLISVAAAVAEHMRMDRERHLGAPPDPAEQSVKGLGRHRPASLRHEDV